MNEEILLYSFKEYEKKLMELMEPEEYKAFCRHVAKEMFRKELDGMASGQFKDFCLENFDVITAEGENDA